MTVALSWYIWGEIIVIVSTTDISYDLPWDTYVSLINLRYILRSIWGHIILIVSAKDLSYYLSEHYYKSMNFWQCYQRWTGVFNILYSRKVHSINFSVLQTATMYRRLFLLGMAIRIVKYSAAEMGDKEDVRVPFGPQMCVEWCQTLGRCHSPIFDPSALSCRSGKTTFELRENSTDIYQLSTKKVCVRYPSAVLT